MFGAEHHAKSQSFLFAEALAHIRFHESLRIHASTTPVSQTLYNLHLEGSPASVGNKKVTTPVESAFTKNTAVTPLESTLTKLKGVWAWSAKGWSSRLSFLLLPFLFIILSSNAQDPKSPNVPLNSAEQNPAPNSAQPDTSLVEAKSLLEKGMGKDAEVIVRKHLETHPDSADGHFLLGYVLFREIQTEARLETTVEGVKSLDVGPADARAREEKARASLAEFTAGAKYHDPSAFDLKIVALDYVLLGDYVDADKWLTRSVEWNPQDTDAWYYLGRARYNENKFADAVSAFQQCLKLSPGNVKAEDNLGLSYAGLGRNEEASAAYKQAMAWQSQSVSKNPGPHIDLGSLLLDENRPEEAVPYLLQAIEIAPRESRAHELLGKAYTRLDKLPEAQTELERAVQLSPQSANLHCMLAPVYRKQGIADKAKAEFDRCAALSGTHAIPETPRP
jgi:tetratricopeptide (TPR) repeat protein